MKRRVLITGAGGFVGVNLVQRCLERDDDVHVITREGRNLSDRSPLQAFKSQVTFHFTEHEMASIAPQTVFHCAAYGVQPDQNDVGQAILTNIMLTARMLRAAEAAGVEVFVNTGSAVEYGANANYANESDGCFPTTTYGITKHAGTRFCETHKGSMRVVTLRLYTPYGPHERPHRLMPKLVAAARRHEYPGLSHPNNSRDFVYIDDVLDAYEAVERTTTCRGTYNVGTGESITLRQLVNVAKTMFGITEEPDWGTAADRLIEECYRANALRLHHETGWLPKYQVPHGLAAIAQWQESQAVAVPLPEYA